MRQRWSLPQILQTVLRCCLLTGSIEDCSEPKGGVVLALCMTILITLLCMGCAAHLRVACDVYCVSVLLGVGIYAAVRCLCMYA